MSEGAPASAIVIGGGIVGLSVASALQGRGVAVKILDAPGDRPPASWGNAGHIATEQHEPLASWRAVRSLPRRLASFGGPASFPATAFGQWLPFGLRLLWAARRANFARGEAALRALMAEALPAWRRLMESAGAADLLREEGAIVAWESPAGARRGRAELKNFQSSAARWRDLTGEEAATLAAQVRAPPVDAVRFEGPASVADPAAVLAALRSALLRRGGAIETRAATLAAARAMGSDVVIVAAGVGSAALMREAGHKAPLIAERGYHIQSAETRWPQSLTSVVFEERALVVTRFLSGLRGTGFVEFTRPEAAPDLRKWERLKAHAKALGLPFDSTPQVWLGSRPTLPDYRPAIGRSPGDPRLLYAFGHQHLGLTLGPVTGEIVAALAFDERPAVDPAAFAIERFG
jgi:D-hydroxyproline dehydrogenase